MTHNRFDECPGISASKYKTYFANFTVDDITAFLFESVCVNRQGFNIAMLNQFFCCLAGFGIIERAISIDAFGSILETCMTENFVGAVMLMVPNQRDFLSIVMFESVFHDNSAVRAFEIGFGSPAAEIIRLHFELSSFDRDFKDYS
jgi:hypothetical protein